MHLYIYTTHIYTCMGNKKEHVSNHLLFLHPLRTIPLIELQIFSLRQTLQRPKIKQKPRASTAHSVERKLAAVACYHAKASRIPVRPFLLYVCAVLLPWSSLAFSLLTSHYFLLLFFPGAVPVTIFFYYFFYYLFPGTLQVTIFLQFFLLINYYMVSRGWLKSPFTTLDVVRPALFI